MEKNNKKNKYKIILIITLVIFCIIAFFSTIFAIISSTNEKVIKGVKIQNIDASGLDRNQTDEKFKQLIQNMKDKTLILKYGDYESTLCLSEIKVDYNLDDALATAYNIGRSGNILKNNFEIVKTMLFGEEIDIQVSYDENELNKKIDSINSSIPGVVQEYSYYIEDENLLITKGKKGITINKDQLKAEVIEKINSLSNGEITINIPVTEKEPDNIDLNKIHSEIYREAQDAYVTKNPTTVHPNVNGVDFAVTMEEAQKIIEEDKDEYTIPLKITVASKTINDLGEEAFPDTLGTFSTRYDASNKNRSNNISLASEKINGTVIMPGEVCSYNQVVGKRTIDAGYKEAGAYAGGKVVQEVGGGICQVSSTLYNAVLYANLEIVERSNHHFETSYVDAGRDATVSWGTVDFKFKNNREYPIKIEAVSKNGVSKMSIKGIGTEKDYEVVIQSTVTSIINKETKYEEDDTLEEGKEVVIQEGHNGATSKTYKILKTNGVEVSKELLSSDMYYSLDKIIKKGTKKNVESTENSQNDVD